jgi:hypothetical protein|tara:strand:+ start:20354 stop:21412 length:1059 start_codon:yes stop_codon:yes gene_type:complete
MATITQLEWSSLTRVVNEIKSPNQFVKKLVFGASETFPTRSVEIGSYVGGREIAPFIREGAEAKMVEGLSTSLQSVQTPNIRIKRPFTPSDLLYGRKPGTPIFPSAGQVRSGVNGHIARDMQFLSDKITNAEEYMCCLALQAAISYTVDDEETFTITYPRPAGHTITGGTKWDDATPADVTIEQDFRTAKKLIADESGLACTDVILGEEAAVDFMELIRINRLPLLDANNMTAGQVTFSSSFDTDGVLFLGIFCGLRVWNYSRKVDVNGTSTSLIRDKYAEFIAVNPAAEFARYYGVIEDMRTIRGGSLQAERFSKSWEVEDPSAIIALVASRPLPVLRRPGATVSMQVSTT